MRTTSTHKKVGLVLLAAVLLTAADTKMNTEQMNYRYPASGTTVRKLTTRLSDTVSVKDFGAVCNGVTDDTTAVNNAVATGKPVVTPETACFTTGALGLIPAGSVIVNGASIRSVGGDLSGTLPNPIVVSTHLTTPLSQTSGGTGTAGPLECGVGGITSSGGQYSCYIPTGLAAPGSSGILLQAVVPGSFQTGNMNIRGQLIVGPSGGPDPTAANLAGGANGALHIGGGAGVSFIPGAMTGGGYSIRTAGYNTGVTAGGTVYQWFGSKDANPMMLVRFDGRGGSPAGGYTSLQFSGCGTGTSAAQPCLTTMSGTTPLYLSGAAFTDSTANSVIVDTNGIVRTVAGNLFQVNNGGVSKFGVSIAGVATSAGLTSTGPVSGTTGTFSGAVSATGYGAVSGTTGTFSGAVSGTAGTFSGAVSGTTAAFSGTSTHVGFSAFQGGLSIGATGSNITASLRATGTVTPGSILSGATGSMSLTVTGAAAGADCVVTPPAGGTGVLALSCWVTTNTCNFSLGNASAGSVTGPAGTWACRVFNP